MVQFDFILVAECTQTFIFYLCQFIKLLFVMAEKKKNFSFIVDHLLILGESAQKQGTPERFNIEEIFKNQLSYSRPLSPSSDDYAH